MRRCVRTCYCSICAADATDVNQATPNIRLKNSFTVRISAGGSDLVKRRELLACPVPGVVETAKKFNFNANFQRMLYARLF